MSGNSKSSVPGSSGTKQDNGSGKDKKKPASSNPSASCQNDSRKLFHRRGVVAGKTMDVPPVTQGDSSNDRGSSTNRSSSDGIQDLFQKVPSASAGADITVTPLEFQRNSHDKPKKDDISSTGIEKSHFGCKDNNSSPEQKLSEDAASQKSHNQKQTNDPRSCFGRKVSSSAEGLSGSVPVTPQSGVSSTTSEHSSEKDTGTGKLQSKTISEGNKSSTSDVFGRQKAQNK